MVIFRGRGGLSLPGRNSPRCLPPIGPSIGPFGYFFFRGKSAEWLLLMGEAIEGTPPWEEVAPKVGYLTTSTVLYYYSPGIFGDISVFKVAIDAYKF